MPPPPRNIIEDSLGPLIGASPTLAGGGFDPLSLLTGPSIAGGGLPGLDNSSSATSSAASRVSDSPFIFGAESPSGQIGTLLVVGAVILFGLLLIRKA